MNVLFHVRTLYYYCNNNQAQAPRFFERRSASGDTVGSWLVFLAFRNYDAQDNYHQPDNNSLSWKLS